MSIPVESDAKMPEVIPHNSKALKRLIGQEWVACNYGAGHIPRNTSLTERDAHRFFKQWQRNHRAARKQLRAKIQMALKTGDPIATLEANRPAIIAITDQLGGERYIARMLDLGIRNTIERGKFIPFLELLLDTI
jgi:hypothetical protein